MGIRFFVSEVLDQGQPLLILGLMLEDRGTRFEGGGNGFVQHHTCEVAVGMG
ncbi:MAG: hypothetical protein AAGA37_10035 [Actinomycetota bacterium]